MNTNCNYGLKLVIMARIVITVVGVMAGRIHCIYWISTAAFYLAS